MKRLPSILAALNRLFPASWLRRTARQCGACQRQRKVEVVLLFWCLMLVPQATASIASFQCRFRLAGGEKVARSAFLRRFSSGLVAFLRACLDHAIDRQVQPFVTPALFRAFKDVRAQDSTFVALSEALAAIFPGSRKKSAPAAAKVNTVASVLTDSFSRLRHSVELSEWFEQMVVFMLDPNPERNSLFLQLTRASRDHGCGAATRSAKTLPTASSWLTNATTP